MSMILLLIPLSILLAAVFLGAFIWAVRSGQYEDTTTPSMRLLLDDKLPTPPKVSDEFAANQEKTDHESRHIPLR